MFINRKLIIFHLNIMEYCICSICKQRSLKNTSWSISIENDPEAYMCENCMNSPVRIPFCSECLCTENLVQIYKDGDFGVYGCEEHFMNLMNIFADY